MPGLYLPLGAINAVSNASGIVGMTPSRQARSRSLIFSSN